jgi:hypothetical protein
MSEATFSSSREALQWCLEQGLISQRISEVLRVLTDSGEAMNQTMAHIEVVRATGNVSLQKYSVSPRFAVLHRMGLIREVGLNPCPITGRHTMFYEATCSRPCMSEAEAMHSTDRRQTNAQLKAENAELKKEVGQLRELLNIRSASHAENEKRLRAAPLAIQSSFAL